MTLILRADNPALIDGTVERFDGRQWQPLQTDSAGAAGFFAIVTEFGEFAVIAQGVSPYPTVAPVPTSAASPTAPAATGAQPAPQGSTAPASPPGEAPFGGSAAALLGVVLGVALLVLLVARRRRSRRDVRQGWGR